MSTLFKRLSSRIDRLNRLRIYSLWWIPYTIAYTPRNLSANHLSNGSHHLLNGTTTNICSSKIHMETLADNLQKLTEDDLLQVVEMIHNNKTADTYTKNDTERAYLRSASATLASSSFSHDSPCPACMLTKRYTHIHRRRILRRSVHPLRLAPSNAMGFLQREAGHVMGLS